MDFCLKPNSELAGKTFDNETYYIQLEKSSSATSWEKYVGGVPSPNPDYPQYINVVTGTQTVSVNGTNYQVNLGDIELCKIDTYQDYIYKSGSEWKVHKAIGSYQFDGTEPWVRSGSTTSEVFVGVIASAFGDYIQVPNTSAKNNSIMSHFELLAQTGSRAGLFNIYNGQAYCTSCALSFDITEVPNATAVAAWVSEHRPILYVPILTATDTTITDTNLIAQLEAVRTASLQASNTITNTATGSNLAGDLELAYCEYDPQNRYDKWLWLDLNNNYEKLGS